MVTRNRTTWRVRADGQFDCRVGRQINLKGRIDQPRFRLGSELREAQRRDRLLRQIWETIERANPAQPLWNDETLELAKQVAAGNVVVVVPRRAEEEQTEEGVIQYAQRVHALQKNFPMLAITTIPDYSAALGYKVTSFLNAADPVADAVAAQQEQQQRENQFLGFLGDRFAGFPVTATTSLSAPAAAPPVDGPSLHMALLAYIEWLKREYAHPEHGVTSWGRSQIKQAESLIAHHEDLALHALDGTKLEEMLQYWRQRPNKKKSNRPIAQDTATNFIKTLRRFVKWLHRSQAFEWRKPEDFEDLRIQVVTLEHERRTQISPDQLFTLAELKLLYQYGTPFDRLLLLLGLNCGFAIAESATLLMGEVHLHSQHSARYREILDFESTDQDSFIKRIRRKNNVYGEFLLFDHTVEGLKWALRQRQKQTGFCQEARLLLNANGHPYDQPTKSGNPNRQIPNSFARLLNRIEEEKHAISRLPFKTLRKTGGDLVKRFSDGEVKAVYHCRGQAVGSDDLDDVYTSRPFGKVFRALRQVEQHLAPMFEAVGSQPFPST